jgi:hypothetical protein
MYRTMGRSPELSELSRVPSTMGTPFTSSYCPFSTAVSMAGMSNALT